MKIKKKIKKKLRMGGGCLVRGGGGVGLGGGGQGGWERRIEAFVKIKKKIFFGGWGGRERRIGGSGWM